MKLDPVANTLPPLEAEYHLYVVALVEPVADNDIVPSPQRELLVTVGLEGIKLMEAVTAVLDPSQPVVVLYPDT